MTDAGKREGAREDLGFTHQVRANGDVDVRRDGRSVTIVRGAKAAALRRRLEGATPAAVQQQLARVTGNYKRGNERAATRGGRR